MVLVLRQPPSFVHTREIEITAAVASLALFTLIIHIDLLLYNYYCRLLLDSALCRPVYCCLVEFNIRTFRRRALLSRTNLDNRLIRIMRSRISSIIILSCSFFSYYFWKNPYANYHQYCYKK